jgi:rare lipoprotein A
MRTEALRRPPLAAPLAGLLAAALLVLGGCASGPGPRTGTLPRAAPPIDTGRDGPEAVIPPNLHLVPDAAPRIEPVRSGGPNKPYEVQGERYEPLTGDTPYADRGLASWYGRKFHGRPTASGEVYNMYAMTAAHPTLPIPSYARVRNPANGREVIVRINDRGPFHKGRIVDLSYTAALKLDLLRGVAPVEVERLTFEDIRTGAWRRDNPAPVFVASAAPGAPERASITAAAPLRAADPAALLAEAGPPPGPMASDEAPPVAVRDRSRQQALLERRQGAPTGCRSTTLALELDTCRTCSMPTAASSCWSCCRALDTSGKDGTLRGVFGRMSPLGVRTVGWKAPTRAERAHDFLWRIHAQVPAPARSWSSTAATTRTCWCRW